MASFQENHQQQFNVVQKQVFCEMNGEMVFMMRDEFGMDAELKKGFKETHENVNIKEGPCGRLFYSEEILNCHNSEHHVVRKKELHCNHCKKSFHCDGNKTLHERDCEHGAKPSTSSRKRLPQKPILNRYVIKKEKEIDSETKIQHGRFIEHAEYWKAPELRESLLKGTAMVYQILFD